MSKIELRSLIKTEITTIYLTSDDKKFLNEHKAIIHESELDDKRKQNVPFGKKVNTRLNRINFKTFKTGHPINISQNKKDNIMACIFYGLCTNIAVNIEKDIFQVKDTPLIEVRLASCSTSVLNKPKKIPEMIVFNQLTNMSGSYSMGFVNRMSFKTLNMFGLEYIHPGK